MESSSVSMDRYSRITLPEAKPKDDESFYAAFFSLCSPQHLLQSAVAAVPLRSL
jgi:hypothetical protein